MLFQQIRDATTLVGLSIGTSVTGTNRGRLVLTDCSVSTDYYTGYENAAGATMILERTNWSAVSQVIRNRGVFEALDSTLYGKGQGPRAMSNYSSGTMTLRRTSIRGSYGVLTNSGTALLDEVTMKSAYGEYGGNIGNGGTMTIRDSRF